MQRNNIESNIDAMLNDIYVVPLYQRNFAWEEKEITRLLQDIYESYCAEPTGKYFVGSIVIRKLSGVKYEVIDGQQRLTVISLIAKILRPEKYTKCGLYYDSRDEIEGFLKSYYETGNIPPKEKEEKEEYKSFRNAISFIKESHLVISDEDNSDKTNENLTLKSLLDNNNDEFINYFFNNVVFVRAEMPSNTDVATYFEIMNNSGEQLQKHEIVKSLMMSKLDHQNKEMAVFSRIWEACSQMDEQVIKLLRLSPSERDLLFGNDYKEFHSEKLINIKYEDYNLEENASIDDIIKSENSSKYGIENNVNQSNDEDIYEDTGASIIDFPNFLMHVLRIKYNDIYIKQRNENIPLNEKKLVEVYSVLAQQKNPIDSIDFLKSLLFYRLVFDRFIVRSNEGSMDNRWTLQIPHKYTNKNEYDNLKFENTFNSKKNDKIIKAISMLQVSFPQRKYKNYLQNILSWFSSDNLNYGYSELLQHLNAFILQTFDNYFNNYKEKKLDLFCQGESTPRFILNFVDYLYYIDRATNKFDFKYYNSVEHHLARELGNKNSIDRSIIDNIGNLCLISKSKNSSLNMESPSQKVRDEKDLLLSPKRNRMYEMTKKNKWNEKSILEHRKEVDELITNRYELLGVKKLDLSDNDTLRAMLCVKDTRVEVGSKFCFKHKNGKRALDHSNIEAYKVVLRWRKNNPSKPLQDYINEMLKDKSSSLYTPNDEWRRVFVSHPSIWVYSEDGNIEFDNFNKYVTLIQHSNHSQYGAKELRAFLLEEKIQYHLHLNTFFADSETLIIPINDSLKPVQDDEVSRISINVSLNRQTFNWEYYVSTKHYSNAWQIRKLQNQGWEYVGSKKLKKSDKEFLATDRKYSIEDSIDMAFKEIKSLLCEIYSNNQ